MCLAALLRAVLFFDLPDSAGTLDGKPRRPPVEHQSGPETRDLGVIGDCICGSPHPGTTLARPTRRLPSIQPTNQDPNERMDTRQVWRAALGELQVSLSPANFETWLRDTALVDVDDNRFRIAVPNGFAKDWLETRYRSLISQTLARIVGYSVWEISER